MVNKTKIVIQEVFITGDYEKRKNVFEEILLSIIKKSEIHKSV